MNLLEAKRIIEEEKLRRHNIFEDHTIIPEEVGIYKNNGKWVVYTSNERCTKESEYFYTDESEAFIDFIERLRADKELYDLEQIGKK